MALTAVEVRNLCFAYPDGTEALRGVDLVAEPGEILGVLGPNGSGKSTLFLHLNGLLRGRGLVRVGGLTISDATVAEVRRRVGLVFQDPDDQLFMPRVWDDVAFGPHNQGLPAAEVVCRVEQALSVVEMLDYRERPPHHLSLGQKKRVALATVLSMDCEVLVLDEPTAGLDPRGRRDIIRFLTELPQTKIIATHDLELAAEVCHRVLVLSEGRIVAEGPPSRVMADEVLMETHGLEVPHSLRYHAPGVPHQHWPHRPHDHSHE